ncbi:MAG: diguanylate cyclase [Acidobacteria bacterium]|nr:diguanylate cyclase [Acidobacteriota bacterium]
MTVGSPVLRRALFAFVPALALFALLLVQWHESERVSGHRVGFGLEEEAGAIVVVDVVEGQPAERAGLRVGDRLLAIDGRTVATERDYDESAERFERGRQVVFSADRAGARLELPVTVGVPIPVAELVLNALVVLSYLALGLLALLQWREDLRARLLYGFALAVAFEFALPSYALGSSLLGVSTNLAYYLLSALQMGLEIHLALLIPERPRWLAARRWVVPSIYSVVGVLGVLPASALLAERLGGRELPWSLEGTESLLLDWGLPVWALIVVSLLGYRFLVFPEKRGRLQAGAVLLGVLPWTAVVIWLSGQLLLHGTRPDIPASLWALVGLAYPLAVLVAVFRFSLLDLEWVMHRSILYGTLTTLLILVFYGALGAGGALFAGALEQGRHSVWVISGATLLLGLLFNPMRQRLEQWIDRRLFPERVAVRQRMIELSSELPAHGKLPRMGEHLAAELCRTFDVESATIWLAAPPVGQLVNLASTLPANEDGERTLLLAPDEPGLRLLARSGRPQPVESLSRAGAVLHQRLVESRAELAVPMLSQKKLLGVLLLGPKRGRGRFSAEELELLTLLAQHSGTVFENARLFDSATYEGLTGLYRREAILEILDREWSRSVRYDRPLSIAVADLDRFKSVNDRYGHLGGDVVLQRVAAELKAQLRDPDFIGRFGGEEFLIVLPETTLDGARNFAEKVRQRVESLSIVLDGGRSLSLTLSIGVASRAEVGGGARGRSRALIAAADEALYAAKNRGRNRVESAPPTA